MKITKLKNASIILRFQESISALNFQQAEVDLVDLISHINEFGSLTANKNTDSNIAPFNSNDNAIKTQENYIYLANLITTLFSHPEYKISKDACRIFTIFKTYLHYIFISAGIMNLDHILVAAGIIDTQNNCRLNLTSENDVFLLLSCYTLESSIELDFSAFYETFPKVTQCAYIGCFYQANIVVTRKSDNTLKQLLQYCSILEDCDYSSNADDIEMQACVNVWMGCTYIDSPLKHELKKSINKRIQKYLKKTVNSVTRKRLLSYNKKYKKKNNPQKLKLVIISEVLSKGHAMHRCYIEYIKALTQYFETTLITTFNTYDKDIENYVSKIIEVDPGFGEHQETISSIINEAPDIIYYPSLGMAHWTIPLCNVRMAPIQIMSPGHPASSFSKCIDYHILSEESEPFIDVNEISETPVFVFNEQLNTIPEIDSDLMKKNTAIDCIKIAINSKDLKIRSDFIQVCKQLQAFSSKKIQFHFFPNAPRFIAQAFQSILNVELPNSIVYEPDNYQTYMSNLSQCDIALGTFPFGGSNSNIDVYLLKIPKVILVGIGQEAYADFCQAKEMNIPEWLITQDTEAYFMSALALIEDDNKREEMSKFIAEENVESALLRSTIPDQGNTNIIPKTFLDLYHSHFNPEKEAPKTIGVITESSASSV